MSTTTATGLSVSTAAATASATKCHLFKIEGYKRIKILYGNGRCLESGAFEAAGRTWRIRFFPDGNKEENAGYISLYLKLEDDAAADEVARNDDVLAEVRLSLVRHHRAGAKPPAAAAAAGKPHVASFTTTFREDRKVVGYHQFIKREDLEKSDFLRDDSLAVRCDVAVLKQSVDAEERAAQAGDMERLGMVCDCNDETCKRHHARGGGFFWLRDAFAKLFLGCFQV